MTAKILEFPTDRRVEHPVPSRDPTSPFMKEVMHRGASRDRLVDARSFLLHARSAIADGQRLGGVETHPHYDEMIGDIDTLIGQINTLTGEPF